MVNAAGVGELGWELHHKSQYTYDLYKLLLEAGKPFGIGDFGTYAMSSLRLEKGFRAWGADVNCSVQFTMSLLLYNVVLSIR